MMFCIYPIVAEHFEKFFGDMDNQFFDEVQSRDGFGNSFVIFVSGIMKSYIFTVIMINTGCGNNRSAEISADVFNGNIRGAEIWLCTNIKPIRVLRVHFIFNFTKRWANTGNKLLKQYFTEGIPKKVIIKMFDRAPWGDIAGATFGNEGVDVGIPF